MIADDCSGDVEIAETLLIPVILIFFEVAWPLRHLSLSSSKFGPGVTCFAPIGMAFVKITRKTGTDKRRRMHPQDGDAALGEGQE
jgi:hypothetical protein